MASPLQIVVVFGTILSLTLYINNIEGVTVSLDELIMFVNVYKGAKENAEPKHQEPIVKLQNSSKRLEAVWESH